MRFHPNDAMMTSATYESTFHNKTSISDENSIASYFSYDDLGRLSEIINPANELITSYQYNFGRVYNPGTDSWSVFSPLSPNYIQTTFWPVADNQQYNRVVVVYTDGLGREIQVQTQDDDLGTVVTAQEYDSIGREWRKYKPYTIQNPGFDPNVLQNTASYYNGTGGLPNDQGLSYSETLFYDDPFNRINIVGKPGSDFFIGSGHELSITYDLNQPSDNISSYPDYSLKKTIVEDENGVVSSEFFDLFNNKVAQIQDVGGLNLKTEYDYDDLGNLLRVRPPNYFNPPHGTSAQWVIKKRYNSVGQITWENTPDADSVRYYYDDLGQLRFQVTGDNSSMFNYWRYDNQGRVYEQGESLFNWHDENLWLPYLNNQTVPPDYISVYYQKNHYDSGDPIQAYLRGRLWKSELNFDDLNGDCEIRDCFEYDMDGNVIQKDSEVFDYHASNVYSTSCDYNNLAEITAVNYPDGVTTVVNTLNKLGMIKSIGIPGDIDYFAEFQYFADGNYSTIQLGLYVEGISYSYNSPGWLTSINSSTFDEIMTYTDGGYGDVGFFNGNIASSQSILNDGSSVYNYRYHYDYDSVNRLVEARCKIFTSGVWKPGNLSSLSIFSFDDNGNILTGRRGFPGSGDFDYEYYIGTNQVKNRLSSGLADYTYDDKGNVELSAPKNLSNLSYHPVHNKVSQIDFVGSADYVKFQYNHENTRTLKIHHHNNDDSKVMYLTAVDGSILNEFYLEPGGESVRTYINGPSGLIAAREDQQNYYYMVKDHLGSTRATLNTSGQVLSYYSYMPFGDAMPYFTSVNTGDIDYQYTGQELDEELDLHNYKARLYDSELMRFYAVDPMDLEYPSMSPYVYTANNPILFSDPDGSELRNSQNRPINTFNEILYMSVTMMYDSYDNGMATPLIYSAPERCSHSPYQAVSFSTAFRMNDKERESMISEYGVSGYRIDATTANMTRDLIKHSLDNKLKTDSGQYMHVNSHIEKNGTEYALLIGTLLWTKAEKEYVRGLNGELVGTGDFKVFPYTTVDYINIQISDINKFESKINEIGYKIIWDEDRSSGTLERLESD